MTEEVYIAGTSVTTVYTVIERRVADLGVRGGRMCEDLHTSRRIPSTRPAPSTRLIQSAFPSRSWEHTGAREHESEADGRMHRALGMWRAGCVRCPKRSRSGA